MAKKGDGIKKYDIVSKDAIDTWDEFLKLARDAHAELLEIVKVGPKLNADLSKVKWAENLGESIKDVTDNLEKLIKVEKQLQLINDKLLGGEEARKAARQKEIADRKAAKEAQRKETEEKKKAVSAAKEQEKAEKAASVATAKAYKERIRYAQQVAREQAKANAATMKFNDELERFAVKSKKASGANNALGGSFLNLTKNVGGAILAYTGITRVMDLVMNSFNSIIDNTKKLDSLHFAMSAVIKDQQEFAQTNVFLDDIIQKYGLDVVDTTNAYIKFRAAVGSSNLTVKEGQEIFNSISKATSVLGLSQEKTNLVFLALEQMLAKGTISSEELRRQMGEQLPVAMTAMAKAYATVNKEANGSVGSLLKFMKEGKVISEEVLPEFAKQVEKALGTESINKVDTLVAATERLNTSWIDFVEILKAGKPLINVYNGLAQAIRNITSALESNESKIGKRSSGIVGQTLQSLEGITDEEERRKVLMGELFKLQEKYAKTGKTIEEQEEKRSNAMLRGLAFINRGIGLQNISPSFTAAIDFEEVYKDTVLDADSYAKAIKEIKDNFDKFVKYTPKEIIPRETEETGKDTFNDELSAFKNNLDKRFAIYEEHLNSMREIAFKNAVDSGLDEVRIDDVDKGLKMNMEEDLFNFKLGLMGELLTFVKEHGKDTSDIEKETAELSADFAKKTTDFKISEEQRYHSLFMKNQEDEQKIINNKKDADLASIEATMQARILGLQEQATGKSKGAKYRYQFGIIDEQLGIDSIKVMIDGYEEMLSVENLTAEESANIAQNLFNAKKSLYEAEREQIQRTAEEQIERQAAVLDFTAQSINEMFSLFSNFQNAKMEQLEWDYEREMNLAGDNVDQKLAAENNYNKEKAKLERRQAIASKANAAFNIILSTMQGVMSAMAAVVTIPLVPFIEAMGAISLAATLATPLPKYEFGGDHDGGPAMFSEKGEELFIPIIGDPILTPDTTTVANMPAGKFIPHDETMSILAKSAINNINKEAQDIDLSETNSILRKMANKDEIIYQDGYKMTNKNNIFGRYVTRN